MALSSRQMLVTEDLKQYSLSSYDPLISYFVGNIVKSPAGSLYTCITSAPAGTLLTNTAFFSPSSSGNGISPTSTTLNSTGTITSKSTSIGANSVAATLPVLSGAVIGDIYYIKVGNFSGCTLKASGSETIDGNTTPINLNPYHGVTLRKSSATNWEIVSDYDLLAGESSGLSKLETNIAASGVLLPTEKNIDLTANNINATLSILTSYTSGDLIIVKAKNVTGCKLIPSAGNTIDGGNTTGILMSPYDSYILQVPTLPATNWKIVSDYSTLAGGTANYNAGTAYNATATLIDPSTGDTYKCIVAAPAGTPLSNTTYFQKITQGNLDYNASTNSPAVASIPNGTELFVETAGTQTISGISYELNKGDLIKKSNSGTYSVIRGQISAMHIEKNAAYTLTSTNIPGDMIIGLHNTHATNHINFTLPAGITTDTLPDYVNTLGTIITVNAGSVVYVRSTAGNKVELLGSDITGSGSGISKTQKTIGANTTLIATEKFAKLTAANIATTLPLLSTVQAGDIFVIKNGNFFGNTVVPQGANTIDGVAGAELLMPHEMMQLRASVGLTEWEKI